MTQTINIDETLDTSGTFCPLPVYKAALVLNRLSLGQVLHIITTDRGSLEDIPALTRQRGDDLVATEDRGATQLFWIRKG